MRGDKFSMFRRAGVWYVQFSNPQTHKYTTPRSTRESDRSAALLAIAKWLRDGVPAPRRGVRPVREVLDVDTALSIIRGTPLTQDDVERIVCALRERCLIENAVTKGGPGSEAFIAFLERFWDSETSPYVHERLAHGQRMSRRHCYEAVNQVQFYWKNYFGPDHKLAQVSKSEISAFSLWLKETKGLRAITVNNILSAGTVALRWATRNDILAKNPSEGLMTFSWKVAKRGVLSDAEVKALFALDWQDGHSRLANMLAMTTGLRAGEILALQVRDIDKDRLFVRH